MNTTTSTSRKIATFAVVAGALFATTACGTEIQAPTTSRPQQTETKAPPAPGEHKRPIEDDGSQYTPAPRPQPKGVATGDHKKPVD